MMMISVLHPVWLLLSAGLVEAAPVISRPEPLDIQSGETLRLGLPKHKTRALSVSSDDVPPRCDLAEETPSCEEEKKMVEDKMSKSISELKHLYVDEGCDDELYPSSSLSSDFEEDEDYVLCKSISDGFCELEKQKDEILNKIEESCEDRDNARRLFEGAKETVALAFSEYDRNRALGPIGIDPDNDPACAALQVTLTSVYKALQRVVTGIDVTVLLLSAAKEALSMVTETIENLSILGFSVGTVTAAMLKVPIGVLLAIITALNVIKAGINEFVNQSKLDDAQEAGDCNALKGAFMKQLAIDTCETADSIEIITNEINDKVDIINRTTSETRAMVDLINRTSVDNQLYLNFLASPLTPNGGVGSAVTENGGGSALDQLPAVMGAGCDGVDNDGDSTVLDTFGSTFLLSTFGFDRTPQSIVRRVDECDEDQIPPKIKLTKHPPPTFPSQAEAVGWFMEYTEVFDDCAGSARLSKSVASSSSEQVTILVVDDLCVNKDIETANVNGRELVVDGPGESSTTMTYSFIVDGDPPKVTCGFNKAQDKNYKGGDPLFIDYYNEKKHLVDVQFWFEIEEIPSTSSEDVHVNIAITSNEFEDRSKREMIHLIEQRNLREQSQITTLLGPFTCGDHKASSVCLPESDIKARFYDFTVVATDSSGNVGEATCTVVAVPEYRVHKSSSSSSSRSSKKKNKRPSQAALVSQLNASKQRYVLEEIKLVWNTGGYGTGIGSITI